MADLKHADAYHDESSSDEPNKNCRKNHNEYGHQYQYTPRKIIFQITHDVHLLLQNLGATPQLECWKNGMME